MKALAVLALLTFSFVINYVIFTAGWGLAVQSWPVVIGGFVATIAIYVIAEALR